MLNGSDQLFPPGRSETVFFFIQTELTSLIEVCNYFCLYRFSQHQPLAMVYDVNLIATLLLGWTAMCQGKMMDTADEPKSVIKEYKAGNLNEKLTIDHVTYDNPRDAPKKTKKGDDSEEGRSVTLNLNDDDDEDDDDDDSPPTTMLTEPSSLKPIGMKRLSPTSRTDPHGPEPTIPEDLLKEVSLMKIPQYDLPKTITSIKTKPLKSFSGTEDDFPNYENDDIMKPDYSKYFNDDYQVPVEYQKFNFKTQPLKDDSEKHVKIEIGKTKVKTVVDEPIIITKTKLIDYNTVENEGNKNSDVYKTFYNGYHDHYRNVQKDKVRSGCYNCYRPLYNPYKRLTYPPPPIPIPPRPHHYPLGSPYVPRYVNRYARSRYVRPVCRPKHAYVMGYPPPRQHLHYRPPYTRPPRPAYLPRPPLPPPPHHPYWYPPPPPRIPPPPPPPKPSCPPSKVVKEVHVHHFPQPSKIEKIPVPVAILEANHEENYEHDTIIEPGPYDEEELDSDEHAELQEINAHLDEALRNNKKELDKNLEEGQRYIIEQEDSRRGSGNSGEDEYKKPNYKKILDQALVKNRKELEKNLKNGPEIVKTAYLPDDGIYNLHKFADKNHLYNFPIKAKAKSQKTSSSSNANDYKLHLESLKDFEPRKILQDGTPIRYILTNKMSYNHTKPQEG